MGYFDDDRTSTIEKEDTSILDLIDERLSDTEEVKRQTQQKKEEKQTYEEPSFYEEPEKDFEPFEFTATTNKRAENVIETPFFGDSDAITKLRNKRQAKTEKRERLTEARTNARVHSAPKRIDGKKESSYGEMTSSRKKMWIGTGVICSVLLVAFMISNIITLSNINNNMENIQSNIIVKEKELSSLEGQIINNSTTIPNGMIETNSILIDASEVYPTDVVTSDNTFNRIARFISYLLGK